jgi:hypothetical protein
MALPPRPMGSLVDSAMAPAGGAMDPSAMDVSVLAPENFEGGAAVTEDGQGGAIVQALAAAMEEMSAEELIPHNANLAEYLGRRVPRRAVKRAAGRLRRRSCPRAPSGKRATPRAWTSWA